MNNIFLSIIVPVYNTEKYLKDCLDSVIQSADVPYEIICINDGSLDNSLSILENYQKKYNFIHIISQANAGLSVARNTGIQNAQGEYIIFLDSDDMLSQNAIMEISKILKKENPEILAYDADCIYETEYLKTTQFKDEYYHRKCSHGSNKKGQDMFCEMIENNDFCDSAWLMAIQRKWLVENQIFFKSGMIYEDCLFSFQCYMQSKKVSHINKRLVIYRIRENSIMQSLPTFKYIESRLEIYCKILKFLMENSCDSRLQNALEKFAEFISYYLKLTYTQLPDCEKEKSHLLNGEKSIIFKNLCDTSLLSNYETQVYIRGFEEIIKNNKSVFIYGAGKVGKSVYEYFRKMGIQEKVKGFIVSEKKFVSDSNDIKIITIAELKDKNAVILLCARKDYQEEMYLEAKKNGFYNIVPINYQLENYITSV